MHLKQTKYSSKKKFKKFTEIFCTFKNTNGIIMKNKQI